MKNNGQQLPSPTQRNELYTVTLPAHGKLAAHASQLSVRRGLRLLVLLYPFGSEVSQVRNSISLWRKRNSPIIGLPEEPRFPTQKKTGYHKKRMEAGIRS